jgi:hypothetical protein
LRGIERVRAEGIVAAGGQQIVDHQHVGAVHRVHPVEAVGREQFDGDGFGLPVGRAVDVEIVEGPKQMKLFKGEPQETTARFVVRIVAAAAGAAAVAVFLNDQQVAKACKAAGAGRGIGKFRRAPVFFQVAVAADRAFAVLDDR